MPTEVAYLPAKHAAHAVEMEAPTVNDADPARQRSQEVAPLDVAYMPGEHDRQLVEPSADVNFPAKHDKHEAAAEAPTVADAVPATQLSQAEAPIVAYLPAAHDEHATVPVVAE